MGYIPIKWLQTPAIQALIKSPYLKMGGQMNAGIKMTDQWVLKTIPTEDTAKFLPGLINLEKIRHVRDLFNYSGNLTRSALKEASRAKQLSEEIRKRVQNPHVISYEGYFRVKPNDPLAQHLRPGVQIISEKATGKPLSYYWAIHDGNNPIQNF